MFTPLGRRYDFFSHLLPKPGTYLHVRVIDGAARIFSYLLCCDQEYNSRQFSCASLRDLNSEHFYRLSYCGHGNYDLFLFLHRENTINADWLHYFPALLLPRGERENHCGLYPVQTQIKSLHYGLSGNSGHSDFKRIIKHFRMGTFATAIFMAALGR